MKLWTPELKQAKLKLDKARDKYHAYSSRDTADGHIINKLADATTKARQEFTQLAFETSKQWVINEKKKDLQI